MRPARLAVQGETLRIRFSASPEFDRVPGLIMGKLVSADVNESPGTIDLPLDASIGALIRFTHRAFADDLQTHLLEHRVNVGMWYFLRALWEEDGLTQRELSRLIGVTEPTALQQLRKMQADGLIERRPSQSDRRKVHIYLTRQGRALRSKLMPYAMEVNAAALDGLDSREIGQLQLTLQKVRGNLQRRNTDREGFEPNSE
jgi:DNA-binding MarR family transcriptional regulator